MSANWKEQEIYSRSAAQHSSANPHVLSLTFLCTGAGQPDSSPKFPATALNFASHSWLIDCGEGTLHQMLNSKVTKLESITRIFITRMLVHHVSGLVPLMSDIMSKQTSGGPPEKIRLQLYGPAGLRAFVRANLKANLLKMDGMYQVNELLTAEDTPTSCAPEDLHQNEVPGDDFVAGSDGRWPRFLASTDEATVSAALLGDNSLGYVFAEPERAVTWHDWLAYLDSVPRSMFAADMGAVRDAVSDLTQSDPEGFLLDDTPFCMRRRGRKVVIVSDAGDMIASLARDADVIVHTSTRLPFRDDYAWFCKHEIICGHSMPYRAGACAREVGAKLLVLNHFEPQNLLDDDERAIRIADAVQQTAASFGGVVIVARDLPLLPVPLAIGPEIPSAMIPRDMNKQLSELNFFALRFARVVIRAVQGQDASPATTLLQAEEDSDVDSDSSMISHGCHSTSCATTPARESPKPSCPIIVARQSVSVL